MNCLTYSSFHCAHKMCTGYTCTVELIKKKRYKKCCILLSLGTFSVARPQVSGCAYFCFSPLTCQILEMEQEAPQWLKPMIKNIGVTSFAEVKR